MHRTAPGIHSAIRELVFGAAALEHCPEDIYVDQVAQIRMPRWHTGRVVLLGDAAAAVSLLAGPGASLGMAAAHVLARELKQHSRISSALTSFETRLRPLVTQHQEAGVSAAEWFVPAMVRWPSRFGTAAFFQAKKAAVIRCLGNL